MNQIFQKFTIKDNINPDSVIFLYNGITLSNKELTFNELANSDDRNRKKMNIIVIKSSQNTSSQIIFRETIRVNNESMKDLLK